MQDNTDFMNQPGMKDNMKELLANMQKTQKAIQEIKVIGEAGGGLVKITMNGTHETMEVKISPTLFGDDDEKDMLEDLILSANNDAAKKLEVAIKDKMVNIAKDIKLPKGLMPEIENTDN